MESGEFHQECREKKMMKRALWKTNISHFWKGDEGIVVGFRKEIEQFTMCIVKNHIGWIRKSPAIG